MVDVLLIVSARIDRCCARSFVHGSDHARATYSFTRGSECIDYVSSLPQNITVIAIVDKDVHDISPFNLLDTLRTLHASLQSIVVVTSSDADTTQRAMLAGACSAVYDTCSPKDLESAIVKVIKSSFTRKDKRAPVVKQDEPRGTCIAVVSARGGSGKSYLATLLAMTLARKKKDALLFDGDIQFSDLGLLFPKSRPIESSALSELCALDKKAIDRLTYSVAERLHLLRFDASPREFESLASKALATVRTCSGHYDATVINTGGFWSLFQANLLESCDAVVVTCDHTLAGLHATTSLVSHLERLHVPRARIVVAINQFQRRGLALHDIEETLKVAHVIGIRSFPDDACISLNAGQPDRVLDEFDDVAESCMVLIERVSMMTGMSLHSTREFGAQIRHVGWLQRVFGT